MRVHLFKDLRQVYGITFTDTHLGRLERLGLFPVRFKLGKNGRNCWLEDEVVNWLKEKADARDKPQPAPLPRRGRPRKTDGEARP